MMRKNSIIREELINAAIAAIARAYAPYSHFPVGAAVRAGSRIFTGCNIENAAYPEGLCAEAVAIGALINAGETQIDEIVIAGLGEDLVTPCGGCRQKIREFANSKTLIHVCGEDGIRASFKLGDLLPVSFGPGNL